MANPEHLEILKQGVTIWNRWREENPEVRPDLSNTELRTAGPLLLKRIGKDLNGANFSRAIIRGSLLIGAELCEADLSEADLRDSDFSESIFYRANLHQANLQSASLRSASFQESILDWVNLINADLGLADLGASSLLEATLSGANLIGANLCKATLRDVVMGNTTFGNVDLSNVDGLDTVTHLAPSTIGIDTLYRSKGKIPEAFLRGCGLPDQMIEYAKSLTANPIEYYSCFISYSSKDEDFATRVHNDLQAAGVRCWFAPHDIQAGKKVHHQIDDAIRVYDKLLLILSPNSMNSNWVGSEIIRAKKKEDVQDSQMLFPLSIVPYEELQDWEFFDSDSGRDLARDIREYFIPDFSQWKDHDSYSKAFERLLRDLKAG